MANVFSSAFFQADQAMVITDETGQIMAVNTAFARRTGYHEVDLIGENARIIGSGRHDGVFFAELWKSLADEGRWSGEVENRTKDGNIITDWLSISAVRDDGGRVQQYIATFTDVTPGQKDEQQLYFLTNFDIVTKLPNRLLFFDRLRLICTRCLREKVPAAVLIIRLDRFQTIVDSHGFEASDEFLRQLANRLVSCVRAADTVGRIGAEEFAVGLYGMADQFHSEFVARKIMKKLATPFSVGDTDIFAAVSIGMALLPTDTSEAEAMVKLARLVAEKVQADGGNSYQFYNWEMIDQSIRLLHLERDLRLALSRNEFELYIQPIFDANSRKLIGGEAGLRWNRPEDSAIDLRKFLSEAEDANLIGLIYERVLDNVIMLLGKLRESAPSLRLAIDVSTRQLNNPLVFYRTRERLDAAGIKPSSLEFIVTESVLRNSTAAQEEVLNKLVDFGIGVAIEDFGTGYSALRHLRVAPIKIAKFDRLFFRNLTVKDEDTFLVKAIIVAARALGMTIVAEGVDDNDQLRFVSDHSCDEAQGLLFSEALGVDQFLALAEAQGGAENTAPANDSAATGR